ncbi:hypothetical protein BV898_07610 [Hypsibius exemplaris]|uniref:Uncharacterized protein n=1 Tax=Hypsibius exemplaris TaxID=2072580 RepID=A0A1W0WT94_HYPEX|nr:hypothetical protein BV898_07610 [Hypsibius exemplaris]
MDCLSGRWAVYLSTPPTVRLAVNLPGEPASFPRGTADCQPPTIPTEPSVRRTGRTICSTDRPNHLFDGPTEPSVRRTGRVSWSTFSTHRSPFCKFRDPFVGLPATVASSSMDALVRLELLSRQVRELEYSAKTHPLLDCAIEISSLSGRSRSREVGQENAARKRKKKRPPAVRATQRDTVSRFTAKSILNNTDPCLTGNGYGTISRPLSVREKVYYRTRPGDRRRAPLANQYDHQGVTRRSRIPFRKPPWDSSPIERLGPHRRSVPMTALKRVPCRKPPRRLFSLESCIPAVPLCPPQTYTKPFHNRSAGADGYPTDFNNTARAGNQMRSRSHSANKFVSFNEACTCPEDCHQKNDALFNRSPRLERSDRQATAGTRSRCREMSPPIRRMPLSRKRVIPSYDCNDIRRTVGEYERQQDDRSSEKIRRLLLEVMKQRREENKTDMCLHNTEAPLPPCTVNFDASAFPTIRMCASKAIQTQPLPMTRFAQIIAPDIVKKYQFDPIFEGIPPSFDWWKYKNETSDISDLDPGRKLPYQVKELEENGTANLSAIDFKTDKLDETACTVKVAVAEPDDEDCEIPPEEMRIVAQRTSTKLVRRIEHGCGGHGAEMVLATLTNSLKSVRKLEEPSMADQCGSAIDFAGGKVDQKSSAFGGKQDHRTTSTGILRKVDQFSSGGRVIADEKGTATRAVDRMDKKLSGMDRDSDNRSTSTGQLLRKTDRKSSGIKIDVDEKSTGTGMIPKIEQHPSEGSCEEWDEENHASSPRRRQGQSVSVLSADCSGELSDCASDEESCENDIGAEVARALSAVPMEPSVLLTSRATSAKSLVGKADKNFGGEQSEQVAGYQAEISPPRASSVPKLMPKVGEVPPVRPIDVCATVFVDCGTTTRPKTVNRGLSLLSCESDESVPLKRRPSASVRRLSLKKPNGRSVTRTTTRTTSTKYVRKISRKLSLISMESKSADLSECNDSEESCLESCNSESRDENMRGTRPRTRRSKTSSPSKTRNQIVERINYATTATQATNVLDNSDRPRVTTQTSFPVLPRRNIATVTDPAPIIQSTQTDVSRTNLGVQHSAALLTPSSILVPTKEVRLLESVDPGFTSILEKLENIQLQRRLTHDQSEQTVLSKQAKFEAPSQPRNLPAVVRHSEMQTATLELVSKKNQTGQTIASPASHRAALTMELSEAKLEPPSILSIQTSDSQLTEPEQPIHPAKVCGVRAHEKKMTKAAAAVKNHRSSSELFEAIVNRLNDMRAEELLNSSTPAKHKTVEIQTDLPPRLTEVEQRVSDNETLSPLVPSKPTKKPLIGEEDLDSGSSSSGDDGTLSGVAYSEGEYIQNPNAFDMTFVKSTHFDDAVYRPTSRPRPTSLPKELIDFNRSDHGRMERSLSAGELSPFGQETWHVENVDFVLKRHWLASHNRAEGGGSRQYSNKNEVEYGITSDDSQSDGSEAGEFHLKNDLKEHSRALIADLLPSQGRS